MYLLVAEDTSRGQTSTAVTTLKTFFVNVDLQAEPSLKLIWA